MTVFKFGICHHRDVTGSPDCRKKKGRAYWMFCLEHQKGYLATHVPQARTLVASSRNDSVAQKRASRKPPARK